MKTISATLGVARSNVIERRDGLRARHGPQERPGDVELASVIRRLVDPRPTYGYRRIDALLKSERRSNGLAPVNAKHVHRLMKNHGVQCVEKRFGTIRAPHPMQWLSDNGSIFAAHTTIEIALALNSPPCFTPVESAESNGTAEAFVKTFKRGQYPMPLPRWLPLIIGSRITTPSTPMPARLSLTPGIHPFSTCRVSGLTGPTPTIRKPVPFLRLRSPSERAISASWGWTYNFDAQERDSITETSGGPIVRPALYVQRRPLVND